MNEYKKVLEKFNIYENYKNELKIKIEKEKNKNLRKDFSSTLKECFNVAKITEIDKLSRIFPYNRVGEPLLHIKKLNMQRWIFFILMILLLLLFYFYTISLPFYIIEVIMAHSDMQKLITAIFAIIICPIFYLMILSIITTGVKGSSVIPNYKDLKRFIKDNLSLLLFPFNKLTTDQVGIHFIIGTKGLFIYSEFNTENLFNTYKYEELLEKGDIHNDAFNKLLPTNCKKKIFELVKKYYNN